MRLEVQSLEVFLGGRPILQDVGFGVAAGSLAAVVGPNGAGKSTLLRAILGSVERRGRIAMDGVDVSGAPFRHRVGGIAYLPQDLSARSALTAIEVVLLGRGDRLGLHVSRRELALAAEALSRLGLASLASRPIGRMSGGQRQLVFLAQALAREPKILLLDEPTSALDLRHQLTVLETVRRVAREQDIAVLAVMHDLNLAARFADRMIVLCDGRVRDMAPPEAIMTTEMADAVFGVEAEVVAASRPPGVLVPLRASQRHRPAAREG